MATTDAEDAYLEAELDAYGGDSVGLPQLDPDGSLFVSQLVWLAITFGFLYVMMSRVALPRIATVIEERRDKIALDLDRASEFQRKSEEAKESYETALADARSRAQRTIEETRRRITTEMDRLRKDSEAQIDARLKEAEARITATKTQALNNVRDVAGDVAGSIVTTLLDNDVSGSAVGDAVEAELRQTNLA